MGASNQSLAHLPELNGRSDVGNYHDVVFNPNLQDFSGPSGPEGQLPAHPYNTDLAFQRTLYAVELIAQQQQAREILAKIPEEYFRRVRISRRGRTSSITT